VTSESDLPTARRPRVLVAEDDANMRALVADILRKEDLDVEELADGQRLLARLVEAFVPRREGGVAVDLIVSDVRMPFCSGLDVLEEVHRSRCPTPVLLMTAFGERGLESRVRALGGRLLDKPFTPLTLREAVRELLGRG
jgi:CheY-like chemotaxis protein